MPSPIDLIYQNLYGNLPAKKGVAYERLAAAVCKLLAPHCEIFHDARMRAEFSKSLYQLDVQFTQGGETSLGEAKDYTADERKVGRGDLQKLGGALGDLPVSKGVFFSATNYTKPALQYAAAAADITGKPIEPFHLRPVIEQDHEGRLESIKVRIHIEKPEITFGVDLTDEGRAKLLASGHGAIQQVVDCILDADGNATKTMSELLPPEAQKAMYAGPPEGSIPLLGAFIRVDGQLIGINGFTYKVSHKALTHEVMLQPNGEATLLIQSVNGTVDKLITDTDLKKVTFNDDNEAVIR